MRSLFDCVIDWFGFLLKFISEPLFLLCDRLFRRVSVVQTSVKIDSPVHLHIVYNRIAAIRRVPSKLCDACCANILDHYPNEWQFDHILADFVQSIQDIRAYSAAMQQLCVN